MLGGHSLGGTVAAIEAVAASDADAAMDPARADSPEVRGLLFFASYPADDISGASLAVLSISGSEDALATPAKIEASRSDLPPDSGFVVIDGASHAQFGSYGPQAGDGTPTIGDEEARALISEATLAFVGSLAE